MNKILHNFIMTLSLGGCAILPQKSMHNNVTTIESDRNDVVIIPANIGNNNNFSIKPLEYSALIAKSPVGIGDRLGGYEESFVNKAPLSGHEKWLSKLRAHAAEVASQVSGVAKSGSLDISKIPIGFSYKMELDKPRKKAKKT